MAITIHTEIDEEHDFLVYDKRLFNLVVEKYVVESWKETPTLCTDTQTRTIVT